MAWNKSAAQLRPRRILPISGRAYIDAVACEESLGDFMRYGWHGARELMVFQSNWHIDCICDYLTAAIDWQIKGPLIFTMPPRHMKSIGINVFLPPWTWAQELPEATRRRGVRIKEGSWRGPGTRFAFIAYAQHLSNTHARQCRSLIESPWYQERWGDRFRLRDAAVEMFSNDQGGSRRALSFRGALTGFGAHIIGIDDAHNIMSDAYETERQKVLDGWDNALNSRLDDNIHGIYIVGMQRSHENDLVGHVLASEFNGVHVCLPYEYERKHPFVFIKSLDLTRQVIRKTDSSDGADVGPRLGEFWEDRRTEGDVLWPERFPKSVVEPAIKRMSAHAAAGQYQQRPTAREGGLFKRLWFDNPVKFADESRLQKVRSWDLASTEQSVSSTDPDWTVGVKMGYDPEIRVIYVLDVIRARLSPAQVETKIKTTAILDGEETSIRIPQDPGGAGKFQAAYLVGQLQGYSVSTEREDGNKEYRANPFAAQCEHGFVKLVEGAWNKAFIEELCAFPNASHDDQVDAVSAGFRALIRRPIWSVVGA